MAQTIQIVISDDGEIGFFAEDGTFLEGKRNIEMLLAAIGEEGAPIDEMGTVEKHRHTHEMNRLHDLSHQ